MDSVLLCPGSCHFIPAKNHQSIKLPKIAEIIFDAYVNSYYRKADELVVVNPCFIKDLEKLGIPREKITYIPNYVDPEYAINYTVGDDDTEKELLNNFIKNIEET